MNQIRQEKTLPASIERRLPRYRRAHDLLDDIH